MDILKASVNFVFHCDYEWLQISPHSFWLNHLAPRILHLFWAENEEITMGWDPIVEKDRTNGSHREPEALHFMRGLQLKRKIRATGSMKTWLWLLALPKRSGNSEQSR